MSKLYYKTLGISANSGIPEIKSAYRRLAKKFHPDLNKSPDAQNKFILVNEAYEFLIRLKSAPTNYHKFPNQRKQNHDDLYRTWVEQERARARARATQEAKRKFDDFKKSKVYKTSQLIFTFYDVFSIIIGILIILASIGGIYTSYKSKDGVQISNIVAVVFLVFLGLMFILFSVSSIQTRNKKSQFKL
jgi:hypothetical protein